MRIQSKPRPLRNRWVVGLLAGACTILLGGLATPPDASAQGRASVSKGSSSGGSGSSQGRASVSRGSGGGSGGRATATRPRGGDGGSGTGTAVRSTSPPRGGHRGGHHHHFHPRYYYPSFYGFSYFRYPYYLGLSYYPYHYGPVWYDYPAYDSLGGIDLNVKPKRAEVYLDGQRIGEVRRFDGYPSMLWLEEGTYDLVIYEAGHETLHETIKIFPGVVIDFDARMEEGVATPPEEIVPPPSAQPRPSEGSTAAAPPEGDGARQDVDSSHQPARLHLTVEPADASVYLDGRFLGTGGELAELRSGLMVNAGVHQLSVVRPSYESEELTVEVDAGEDVELAVRLEAR